jgi:membrane protein YqaA with SNARE-associated domain
MSVFKKIYHWIMLKAQSPQGKYILFAVAFIESIFSIFPLTILFIALALADTRNSHKFALISTIGAVTGAMMGYGIGHYAWIGQNGEYTSFAYFFFNNVPGFSIEAYRNIQELFTEWGIIIIFIAGFTPLPFELFTITSGVFNINFIIFLTGAIIGRGSRYFLLAFLIWKYGEKVKLFIEKYFNLLAFGLTTAVVGIFVFIRLFI